MSDKAKCALLVVQIEGDDLTKARALVEELLEGMFHPITGCRIGGLEVAHLDDAGAIITHASIFPETDDEGLGASFSVDDKNTHDDPDDDCGLPETIDRIMVAIGDAAQPLNDDFTLHRDPELNSTTSLPVVRFPCDRND